MRPRSIESASKQAGLPVCVNVLQRADRFVFTPLCFILTLMRRGLREADPSKEPHPHSLLFVKLAEHGSTVPATRAIRRATDWLGRENVYFIVFEENRFILDVMELVVQKGLSFPENHFDRVVAVHVLEHLPNLPAAIREMHRLCTPDATASVVIPCEGSIATTVARRFSARRLYEKRYGHPYDHFIRRERLNLPDEIAEELTPLFETKHRSFSPVPLPITWCNVFIGMTLRPRK